MPEHQMPTPTASTEATPTRAKLAPSKDELAALPPFQGLTLAQIEVPATRAQFEAAARDIQAAGVVGFDTESKPTFATGEVSTGPHVLQFALESRAYIFQIHHADSHDLLIDLLHSATLVKVGFGLSSDRGQIRARLGQPLRAVLDLNTLFRGDGYRSSMGVRGAVGLLFGQRFQKSKKVTTSNWALPQLSGSQLLYAANDAWAALRVLRALDRPRVEWPVDGLG
jgi:ribonuclease D